MAKKKTQETKAETLQEVSQHREKTNILHINGMYENWFIDYASYVILERAVPHINDGLKPVQRRIMHSMWDMEDGRYNKVANIIGHCMKYHPHGDASIGDALVAIGQKELLIDMQGNWGNIFTGDSAAAPRYIEARLSKFALEVAFNPKTTQWSLSYDGRNKEPVTLPMKFPLLLAQGVEGIAVGLACKILPHNFIELIEGSIAILKKQKVSILPDFPTGGIADFSKYNDGLRGGRIRVRAKIEKKDKKTLVITEVPFGTTTQSLIDSILAANDKGKIKVKKVEDNTAAKVEIVILLHPESSEDIEKTIDALYAFTDCEVSISPNACVIVEDKPRFMGVNEILEYNTNRTVELLKRELEIRKNELGEEWHFSSLIKIFIEKKIYRSIEECTTWEGVLEAIDTGLKPYRKKFKREITREDIISLTEIKIKRISKYDVKEQDEKIKSLEAEMAEIEHHLAHIKVFAINYFKELIKKYGKGKERKTKIASFEAVVASEVMINNQKLYVNREEGFAGYGIKKDEFLCECSDLDEIVVFRGDGTMIVTKVGEKKYVGKDVRHIALFRKTEPEMVYNLVYQDGRGGNAMVKRFTVGGTTRDKEYVLTKGNEGSKVLYFSISGTPAEIINVKLRPKPKLRKTEFEFDLNQIEVKGRGSIGNILTRNLVARISKGGSGKAVDKPEQLNIDGGGAASSAKKKEKPEAAGKKDVRKNAPVVKQQVSAKITPIKKTSVKPVKDEAPLTMEWDLNSGSGTVQKDRARILSEIEKKTEVKKKSQLKMDM
ncbi:MAG: DNA gyrase/topoisomerase IV subunit A [Bacteroidota bacterium]